MLFMVICFLSVHLQRVTSASIVSQAVIEKETDDADQREKRIQQSFGQCDEETYTFHWQEKLFCQVCFYAFIEGFIFL